MQCACVMGQYCTCVFLFFVEFCRKCTKTVKEIARIVINITCTALRGCCLCFYRQAHGLLTDLLVGWFNLPYHTIRSN